MSPGLDDLVRDPARAGLLSSEERQALLAQATSLLVVLASSGVTGDRLLNRARNRGGTFPKPMLRASSGNDRSTSARVRLWLGAPNLSRCEFFEAWQQRDQLEIMVSPRPEFQMVSDVLGEEKAIARYFVGKHMDALK
jgi:hypothetical protein